ncbi:MAG: AAA family ATPase [bacterium]|nr:AAA family ATPase [bacterium]
MASEDPNAFFQQFPYPVIIDEIQRVPQLLSYIQSIVDEKEKKGMFILTGSHQLGLNQSITQSLAGRTALLHLLPLSIAELEEAGITAERDEYLYNGFLPRIYKDNQNPTRAYRNYFQTYIERDLRQMINLKNLRQFQMFLKLLAGRVGQLIPIEIKSARTLSKKFSKGINYFKKISANAGEGYLIYAGELTPDLEGLKVRNFSRTFEIFD